jgi:hypothetical protein
MTEALLVINLEQHSPTQQYKLMTSIQPKKNLLGSYRCLALPRLRSDPFKGRTRPENAIFHTAQKRLTKSFACGHSSLPF